MKYFAPSRVLCPFIKSFVNFFADIGLVYPDRSFSLFSTSKYFVLSEGTILLLFVSFLLKSVFFMKP